MHVFRALKTLHYSAFGNGLELKYKHDAPFFFFSQLNCQSVLLVQ